MNGKGTNVQFGYDDYGNLVSDPYKEITDISYNHLNLPVKITFGGGGKIEYFYDATGLKLKKKVTDGTTITTTDYMDGFQYTNGKLDFFPHAEGYAKAILSGLGGGTSYTFKYVFSYTDHLGNIRVKYAQNPANGNQIEILEEDHYYPYGLKHIGYNGNHTTWDVTPGGEITLTPVNPFLGDTYKYKFGGKEYQTEFDINSYDFGARNYDPALGRWMNIDPLAEQMRRHSPYNYAFDNPVYFIDPDGMMPTDSYGMSTATGAVDVIGSTGDLDVRTYDKDGKTLDLVTVNSKQGVDINADGEISKNNRQTPADVSGGGECCGGNKGISPQDFGPPPVVDFDGMSSVGATTGDKYNFKAGNSYPIASKNKDLIDTQLGGHNEFTVSYKNETISTSGYKAPEASVNPKRAPIQLFMKSKGSNITFYQNTSGSSLRDIFNQTSSIQTVTTGAIVFYTNIQGMRNGTLYWETHHIGSGLGAGVSGTAINQQPNFESQ